MSENTRKMLSLLMAAVMVFSMMPMSAGAQEQATGEVSESTGTAAVETIPDATISTTVETTPEDVPDSSEPTTEEITVTAMVLGANTAVITTPGSYAYFSFTPVESSTYTFYSTAGADTYATLFDGEMNEICWDDDSGDANNFSLSADLTVGETYILSVHYYDAELTGAFSVIAEKSPLESLTFTPVTIIEGTNGNMTSGWNPETEDYSGEYFFYEPSNIMSKSPCTAIFDDGTTYSGTGSHVAYNGMMHYMTATTQQDYTSPWTAGNTYTIEVSVMGKTGQVSVTIMPSPLQSITFTPITLIEGDCRYQEFYWDEEMQTNIPYYRYNPWDVMSKSNYTATFTDGTTHGGSGNSSIYYNGEWYGMTLQEDQSYQNQWTVGNTYYIKISIMGKTVEVPVNIIPSPLVSFTVSPVTVIEGKGGSENSYWPGDGNEHTYYTYYWWNRLNYTATFNDGTVINGVNGSGFWYNGAWYNLSYSDSQGGMNPWTAGNTYTATASLMGMKAEVSVTVDTSPLLSVTFDPIMLEENVGGYWNWDEYGEYFKYDWQDKLTYTATFKDGTVLSGTRWNGVYYGGEYYGVDSTSDSQNGENPWLVDNTYSATVTFAGKNYDVYITVSKEIEENGFTYLVQNEQVIITGCTMQTEILQIPDYIDGYPVVGIISLGEGVKYAKEIRIPDSVTMLSDDLLKPDTYGSYTLPLKKLTLGSGVVSINVGMLLYANNLEQIDVAEGNPYLCSIDGVVYDKDVTTLIAYPPAKESLHVMPDSVTDASSLFDLPVAYAGLYSNINVQLGAGIQEYEIVDGIIYNPDMTAVIKATAAATGSYVMPDTVTEIEPYAFAGSNLTAITLGSGVTEIAYSTFDGAISLEEITIPESVRYIANAGFASCTNLKRVNIFDLNAWCEIHFSENPLAYAHDLYLNGKKIVDLVLPETVAEGVYSNNKINYNAFMGGSFESVTIPTRIDDIGYDAFYGCENLKKVYITDLDAWVGTAFGNETANPLYYARDLYLNGEKIVNLVLPEAVADRVYAQYEENPVCGVNDYAFCNINIESLTVPSYVYVISGGAFAGSSVEEVVFEEGVSSIGESAFENTAVQSLDLPDSLQTIESAAFRDCVNLESVTFGSGLQSIIYEAFRGTGLKSVVLPDSLTFVGGEVFADCKNLETVDLGNSLNAVSYRTFYNTGLKTITLPKQVELVDSGAFADSALTEVIVECDELSIMYGAFQNCPLGDLDLGENVVYISDEAFSGINATQIKHPASVTEISYRVYAFNENLVSVTIPDTVQYISGAAFDGDKNLSHVLYTGTQDQWNALEVWRSEELQSATLHCEATGDEVTTEQTCTTVTFYCSICDKQETVQKSKATHTYDENGVCTVCGYERGWEYTVDEDAGAVTITGYTGTETELAVPSAIDGLPVTAFTKDVFANNRKLTSVALPDSITEIPEGAFENCVALEEVSVGEQVTTIGASAFAYCYSLRSLYLPDTVTYIGDMAFCYSGLSEFELPKNVTYIGEMAFTRCEIEKIEIPAGVTEISYSAFSGCWRLEEVTIPDTVTAISYYAFSGTNIKEFAVPASVQEISPYALSSYALDTVIFMGDQPDMFIPFDVSGVSVFYSGENETWSDVFDDGNTWYPCYEPQFIDQSWDSVVEPGETVTMYAYAYGHRLNYQWYYEAPGTEGFVPVGGDSVEHTVTVDETTSGGRFYCEATDVVGQIGKSDIITVENPSVITGIDIDSMPWKTGYLVGEELDLSGLRLNVYYSNNTVECIYYDDYDLAVSGFDSKTAGTKIVAVTYQGFTTTFEVVVHGQIIVDTPTTTAGKTVDVKISLKDNPGLLSATMRVEYDSSVLTLIKVTDGGILGVSAHRPTIGNPYTLVWVNDGLTTDFTEDGAIVTLTFEVAEDADPGQYNIWVYYDWENYDIYDADLQPVLFIIQDGYVEVSGTLFGDVNRDGVVNNMDRLVLTRYLANWEGYGEDSVDLAAADVNCDGAVNNLDRMILVRYLADWEGYEELPFEKN